MVEVLYISWDKAIEMCYRLALDIASSGYKPDAIVAVLRGGVVPALIVSDVLGVDTFYAVRAKHWGIAEEVYKAPLVEQLPQGRLEGKKVLVVDEVADTGKTLNCVIEELRKLGALEVRSAVLHLKPSSIRIPDYYVEKLSRWTWIFYPWSLVETLYALAHRELGEKASKEELLKKVEELVDRLGVKGFRREIIEMGIRFYKKS
ncbi:MAG: phosphoribosyltransferase [Thermoprotei archaeon]|nr:MAG: phosphoribosyltransferase [Thermoprotei archaeon]